MPILFSLFIIFCVWLSYEIKKNDRINAKSKDEFLAREHEANFAKKQSTDDLARIILPDDIVFHPDVKALQAVEKKIQDTFTHEIINLTGYTNTELKLSYGRANIDYLSECDNYFTKLVPQLKDWVVLLSENNLDEDCKKVLDFAISVKADNSDFFVRRAKYYIADNQSDKINELIKIAQSLNSIHSTVIVDKLNDLLVDSLT